MRSDRAVFGRARLLARFAAVLLLAWTVADLVDVRLCSLDQAAASTEHMSRVTAGTSGAAPAQAADDCFCCSQSVQAQPIAVVRIVETDADFCLASLPAHLLTFHQSLDRPPQIHTL